MDGRIKVYYKGELVGSVLQNRSMTADEIIDFAGVETDVEHGCFIYKGELLSSEDFEIIYE